MPLLEVNQLVKRFAISGSRNVVQAVNGISFTVEAGETLGIVGESGSGKTTVGRCILGLTDITSGSIKFNGTDLMTTRKRNPASLRGQIQIVFQEPADALDPRVKIGSCIAEPLVALGVSASETIGTGCRGARPGRSHSTHVATLPRGIERRPTAACRHRACHDYPSPAGNTR